jgi:acetyl esterase/lipase
MAKIVRFHEVEHRTRGFLQEVNSGGATPLDQLPPKEARDLVSDSEITAIFVNYTRSPVPDLAQRREVYASRLQAGIEQLKGLPPAHIQVAGNDVLRDEGVAYARKLDAAEVEVTLVRYDSMIHDYCFFNHLSRIPAVRTALHQAAEELKRYLKP